LIEKLTLDKEIAEENLELLQKEFDDLKLENEELKEEMELKTLEMEELDEDADSINVEDLKSTLRKLY